MAIEVKEFIGHKPAKLKNTDVPSLKFKTKIENPKTEKKVEVQTKIKKKTK